MLERTLRCGRRAPKASSRARWGLPALPPTLRLLTAIVTIHVCGCSSATHPPPSEDDDTTSLATAAPTTAPGGSSSLATSSPTGAAGAKTPPDQDGFSGLPNGVAAGMAPPRAPADGTGDVVTGGGNDDGAAGDGGAPESIAMAPMMPSGSSSPDGEADMVAPDPSRGEAPLGDGDLRVFPAPGATNVCPDPVIRMRFPSPPQLGSRGRLQLFAADSPERAMAILDMADRTPAVDAGGQRIRSRRAIVDGDQVLFYPPIADLRPGQTYLVTVDEGVVQQPQLSITAADNWRFTLSESPASEHEQRVAHDGSGDYCSILGALAAVPAAHAPITLNIGRGKHLGPFVINNGQDIAFRGDDRKETVLLGENNEKLNPGTATRALFSVDRSQRITLENLTIHNLTPQGGGQAEALRLQRCDHCVARQLDVLSLQDTLLLSGSVYMEDSYVEGNVDYIWGGGAAYFKNSEFKTVGRGGYLVQSRNPVGETGYVFVDCRLTRSSGVDKTYLARIEADRFPGSEVVFIDCAMDSHILREGFQTTGGLGLQLRFLEYGSVALDGSPVDMSGRHPSSKRISAEQAEVYRNPEEVLGFRP